MNVQKFSNDKLADLVNHMYEKINRIIEQRLAGGTFHTFRIAFPKKWAVWCRIVDE